MQVIEVTATFLACMDLLPYVSSALALDPKVSSPQSTHVDSFLGNLVQRFSESGFIFHTEESKEAAPSLGGFPSSLRGEEFARLVISHPEGVANVPRPIGYQFIHVVQLRRPSGFLSFVEGKGSVRPPDRVLFVVSKEALKEEEELGPRAFWRKGLRGGPNRIHRLGSTVFAVSSETRVALYDVCHFCGPLSGVLRPTGIWGASDPHPAFVNLDVFPDNWSDLRGQEIGVLYVPFPPVIWCEESVTMVRPGGCRQERVCASGAFGPEGRLLDVASRSLNFTARLVEFSGECNSSEENRGTTTSPRNDASLWDAMITFLQSSTSDNDLLAVGDISITAARTEQVYFTQVFNREPHNFAYLHRRPDGATFGVAGPFSTKVWACLAAAWVATGLILAALHHASCRLIPKGLWTTGAIMLGQGIPAGVLTASRPGRSLFLCWCWLCFVLASIYESKLVSSLVYPAAPQDPSTLEDLLLDRYEMVTPRSSLFAVRGLLNSTDSVYRSAGDRMRVLESVEDCVGLLVEASRGRKGNKVALIAEHTFLRWGLPKMLPEGIAGNLRLGSAEILAFGQAWALRRDAMALEPPLSLALASATASGLPRYWLDRSLKNGGKAAGGQGYPQRENATAATNTALPLKLFTASLCIWGGGLTAATAILIAEVALNTFRQWRETETQLRHAH